MVWYLSSLLLQEGTQSFPNERQILSFSGKRKQYRRGDKRIATREVKRGLRSLRRPHGYIAKHGGIETLATELCRKLDFNSHLKRTLDAEKILQLYVQILEDMVKSKKLFVVTKDDQEVWGVSEEILISSEEQKSTRRRSAPPKTVRRQPGGVAPAQRAA